MTNNSIHQIMLLRMNVLPPFAYDDDEGDRDDLEYVKFFQEFQADCLSAVSDYLSAWKFFILNMSSQEAFERLLKARKTFILYFPFAYDEMDPDNTPRMDIEYLRQFYSREAANDRLSSNLMMFRDAVKELPG